MEKLSAFPSLAPDEFIEACEHVRRILPDSTLLVGDLPGLRITRRLAAALLVIEAEDDHEPVDVPNRESHEDDVDEEAIIKQPQDETLVTVYYDILLSPSYRVPVVYMTTSPPLPASQFFNLVVPLHFQDAVRGVGVIGALSMTDHPETGMPAYFVHPCRTADTMSAAGAEDVRVQDYMLLWLGVVGASVGLNVSSTDLRRA
ncbi:hypothetical protein E4T38_06886 [Aureobasidium subglaciale]|nr:hypothetical protein E4T38_06886 [Aureobasidium subglaciale]KAI5218525.1 hypothetical protein E4T40_06817 [Aureobasidium subglaciale]KAI5222144.1 hypothetical protein E4T41_06737 [Aureobasidium subglaciale]KAI5259643.1 hypothetical protein E4T46_06715 [Aureobasidium subglaciale]